MKEKVTQDAKEELDFTVIRFPDLFPDEQQEAEKDTRRAFVTVDYIDENGEVVDSVTRKIRQKNGSGFVISYTARMCEFLEKVNVSSIVRVFVYIAHHQNYGTDGKTFGYRCSHHHLEKMLSLDRMTLWRALKYLKENYLVHVGKIEGYTEFMVNPNYVTIGTDRKSREFEWNRRWALTFKEEEKKRLLQEKRDLARDFKKDSENQ